ATHRATFILTGWKTFGVCSNALCMELTSTSSLFICSDTWTNKHSGLTSAKRAMAVDLLRRFAELLAKGCGMRSSSAVMAFNKRGKRRNTASKSLEKNAANNGADAKSETEG